MAGIRSLCNQYDILMICDEACCAAGIRSHAVIGLLNGGESPTTINSDSVRTKKSIDLSLNGIFCAISNVMVGHVVFNHCLITIFACWNP